MDSNHRRRKPADLQSAPVGHLGNLPKPIKTSRGAGFSRRIVTAFVPAIRIPRGTMRKEYSEQ